MKKLLLLAGATVLFSTTSCKKDYTCTCTYNAGAGSTTTTYTINDSKKSDAEDVCTAWENSWKIIDATASCSL